MACQKVKKMKKADIHKAGGIIIRDKKILVGKSKDMDFYICPGGSVEKGETPEKALVRELLEEFKLAVSLKDIKKFGSFFAKAAGDEGKMIMMDVFHVNQFQNEPIANAEIEDLKWIDSNIPKDIKVGSIIEHEIIPRLKKMNLIR